jgi:NitT/TauT family transport system ATP-binding protein
MLKKDHLPDCQGTLRNVPLDSKAQEKLSDNNYVQINELLNSYGLITFPDYIPSELPCGLRQKTTFLRTLLLEPDILLLDEPFATMDYQVSLEDNDNIREAIWEAIRQEKKTTLLITSDIKEAMCMADRIIILSSRPGTVTQILDIVRENELKK